MDVSLLKKVLTAVENNESVIFIFAGDAVEITPIVSTIANNLPEFHTSLIRVECIENSTSVLKGSRNARVFYTLSCFQHTTPEQFLQDNYNWFFLQIIQLYDKQPGLEGDFSVEDAFQECSLYLDRILSKYVEQCNIRTYVRNRIRAYFSRIIESRLEAKYNELIAQINYLENKDSDVYTIR